MGATYCTDADLYRHGLPRGLVTGEARPVTIDASADTIALAGHGLEAGDTLEVVATTLPGGLSASTTYYVVSPTADRFQVAATSGGAAIDLTSAGAGVYVVPSFSTELEEVREYASRLVDTYVIGHEVPFSAPFPQFIVGATAKLAARELLSRRGHGDAAHPVYLAAERVAVEVRRMSMGLTLRDTDATDETPVTTYWSDGAADDTTNAESLL